MPTRIVLDVPDKRLPAVSPAAHSPFSPTAIQPSTDEHRHQFLSRHDNAVATKKSHAAPNNKRSNNNNKNNKNNKKNNTNRSGTNSSKRIVTFRSSIFRGKDEEQDKTRGISRSDIRASPRLIGYIYQLLASAVLLISVVKFYRLSETDGSIEINTEILKQNFQQKIYDSVAGPVYFWKLIGSAVVGSIGAAMTLIITVAHFDTFCFPRFWIWVFRDGSAWEQNILRFMMLFWVCALHVCTSSLSVGEVQGNVFFTTWIAAASSFLNYGVWRKSAGFPSLAEKISAHHRETTYNWLWLLLCIVIFAGASTDIYFNRSELDLRFGPDGTDLTDQDWKVVLALIWSFVGLAMTCVILNHYSTRSIQVRLGTHARIILGWRHFEGIVILFMVGVFFFLLIELSGVDGVVNGSTNGYFSLWGAFFNSVFLLGTWLRENKNIEYFVGEDEERKGTTRAVTFVP